MTRQARSLGAVVCIAALAGMRREIRVRASEAMRDSSSLYPLEKRRVSRVARFAFNVGGFPREYATFHSTLKHEPDEPARIPSERSFQEFWHSGTRGPRGRVTG